MRSHAIVLFPPCGDLGFRVREIPKPTRVQALLSEPPIEAFNEGVLDWLAWLDVGEPDAPLFAPGREISARKFWAVVHHNPLGPAPEVSHLTTHTSHPLARQRRIDFNGHTLTREVIEYRQGPNGLPTGQTITDKIHRPLFIGCLQRSG